MTTSPLSGIDIAAKALPHNKADPLAGARCPTL